MLFYVVPFFGGIYSSLMDGSFENQFVGLANYERTLQNSMFQLGLKNTWELSLLCAPVIWLLAFLLAAIRISRIPPKSIVKGMKPLIMILIFTGVLNLFYTDTGRILVRLWKLAITTDGLERAVFMTGRILMLISGTFLLTYTTSPISLTDGLESLMGPLKKIHVPVHELSMMMCIALRFIPTLIEETDKIMNAQKARGADFENGSLIDRAKALIPVLVPLFISAFRRADELATAMECRCYQGGEGRTKMKLLRYGRNDFRAYGAMGLLVALVLLLAGLGL